MTIARILTVKHALLTTKSVASILENDHETTIQYWMELVEDDEELTCVPLSFQDRTGHLPQLLRDLVYRLRHPTVTTTPFSIAAREHGSQRRRQGYTPAMIVEESRILEVSIFTTIQKHLRSLDASKV